ncbi:MAG: DHH family phosphoesterase [Pseudomonadota bacterium]
MDQIIQQLTNSRRVFLASHLNPDGDAIGSLIAMGLALEKRGKDVTMYNESPIPAVYRFLPAVDRITDAMDAEPGSYDAAVVLDCGDLQRVGSHADRLGQIPVVINIDHHITNTRFGHHHQVDAQACATAEIVYRLITAMGVSVDLEMATAIYTAIFTDTGSFRFSSTNRMAFAICDEMVGIGVDPYKVAQNVYGTYSLGRIKLLNLALDSIEIAADGQLSIMTLSQDMLKETNTHPEDADGLINYAKRIRNVRLAALIHEQETNGTAAKASPPRCHVSLRSDGTIDVARIAAHFGGGGHASAAGFNMNATAAAVKTEIIRIAERL